MTYDESSPERSSPERAMRELLAASTSLRQTLRQVREKYPNLPKMDIRVTERTEEQSSSDLPPVIFQTLIIGIEAESQAHAEQHAAPYEDQGCVGTSTGPSSVEMDCSGLP